MFRHFGNTVTLNLDLIALGIVSLKVTVTRYLASPSAKCCKYLFSLSFDRGVIMGFFRLQQMQSPYGTISIREAEIVLKYLAGRDVENLLV